MPVIVCSFMPGERLNLGPLDRRLTSWALRLLVRSVTRLALFVVTLSEEVVLLVLVLVELFPGSVVVFVWSEKLFGLSFFEMLALLRFPRLSSSVGSSLLCRLLAVLYAKYLWGRILDATSGVKSDVILSSSCRCSRCLMAMILRSALLLSFRTRRFVLCLDFPVMDSIRKSYGSLRFSIVFGKTLSGEHWRRKKSLCLLAAKVSLLRNIFFTRTNSAWPKPSFDNRWMLSFSSILTDKSSKVQMRPYTTAKLILKSCV